jgi:hypothetical protein
MKHLKGLLAGELSGSQTVKYEKSLIRIIFTVFWWWVTNTRTGNTGS